MLKMLTFRLQMQIQSCCLYDYINVKWSISRWTHAYGFNDINFKLMNMEHRCKKLRS